jgi:transcriptional regulator with XRE-family HTH domain
MAMTLMAHAPSIAAQIAALTTFLAAENHPLAPETAAAICSALKLTPDAKFKEKAKQLRDELRKEGVLLGQAHALEALSRMAGFTSYMRAKEALKHLVGDFARDGFLMRVRVTGREEPQFVPYASLPEAANAVIEQLLVELSIPGEPVLCEMHRTPQAVSIEVCRAQGPWLKVELLPYSSDAGVVNIAQFDAECQRTFLDRLLRTMERGRPGALVLYGLIPRNLAPWHYASFTLTFESGITKYLPNERELFFLLESVEFQHAEVAGNKGVLVGREGTASLAMAWNCYDGTAPVPVEISAGELANLVDRFRRWRAGLKGSVTEAVLSVAAGPTNGATTHPICANILTEKRAEREQSLAELARLSGLTEQTLERIEKFGIATETDIVAISRALGLNPNILLERPEGQIGFEITEPQHLLNSMKGVHQYGTSYPDDLDSETEAFIKATAEGLQDLGDVMAMSEGVMSDQVGVEPVDPEHLLEYGQSLLDSIHEQGLILIASRSLSFARGEGRLAGMDGMPLHNVTFRFQPADTAPALRFRG